MNNICEKCKHVHMGMVNAGNYLRNSPKGCIHPDNIKSLSIDPVYGHKTIKLIKSGLGVNRKWNKDCSCKRFEKTEYIPPPELYTNENGEIESIPESEKTLI